MTIYAGQMPTADQLNTELLPGTVIARGRRVTSSTAAAAEQSVLRVDAIPVKSGRLYWIATGSLALDTTVSADSGRCLLRYDNTGASATTASTVLTVSPTYCGNNAQQDAVQIGVFYAPASDETLSILLTTARLAGTGNISLLAAATSPIDLYVMDCSVDPGDSGVDL